MAGLYPFIYKLFTIVKMIKLLGSLVLASGLSSILSTGCASPQYDSYYNVLIDPTFSTEDQTAIVDAVNAWQHITGDGLYLTFNVSVGDPGQCASKPTSHQICIHSTTIGAIENDGASENVFGFTRPYTDGGGEIFIPTAKDAELTYEQLTTVVSHEVGHSLGLSHTTSVTSNVMYAGFSHAALLPTCGDFQQYIDLRGGTDFGANPVCPNGGTYALADGKEKMNR